ncbi:MAG: formylglycine-generating enzyme family protein [Cyanobacteria bacterium J06626_18]
MSWYEAIEFCNRLSKYTGREYRLPSEAEWEYACRAGTATPYYFGMTISENQANYDGRYKSTTEVGRFPPNAFGLHDMHGNVFEWCLDDWHDNYQGAPTDGSAWLADGERKVIRGGSWLYDPWTCRSAYRLDLNSGDRYNAFGFRVVCAVRKLFNFFLSSP